MNARLLVTVADAATMLALSEKGTYTLAANGDLEKKYIGNGKRNFRITVASIEAYVDRLDSDPAVESA